jgi:hypothetical protein
LTDLLAAIRLYRGYRYTIATIANGVQPHTVEAELWYELAGKWRYFRRYTADTGPDAGRRVEADFTEWVEGQREAESGGP